MNPFYGQIVRLLCLAHGLTVPTAEYPFHPTRKWRLDFAWVNERVGLEVDGGIWTRGRHNRGAGWHKDAEKRRELAALGWVLIPVTPEQLEAGIWTDPAKRAIALFHQEHSWDAGSRNVKPTE